MVSRLTSLPVLALVALAALAPACSHHTDDTTDDAASSEDDLTSLTARERTLTFESVVYVAANASDQQMLAAVEHQTKSGFGALREAEVGANTRELGLDDTKGFIKEPVVLIDPTKAGDKGTPMVRVRYRYTDRAVVPVTLATRTAISLGLLTGSYESQTERILKECTGNQAHDREFASAIWYVFNPTLSSCKAAMTDEQLTIDTARKGLTDPKNQVVAAEVNRLYTPMTAKLESKKMTAGTVYPEYDRLFSGGVKPGRLVVGMVSGLMADWAAGEKHDTIDDDGYKMYFQQLREIFAKQTGFKLVKSEPAVDLTTFTAAGKTVTGVSFQTLIQWELDGKGFPTNFTSTADRRALRVAVGDKLLHAWLSFEQPIKVSIGGAAAKPLTLELNTYFGAEGGDAPHRRAIRTSDVVVYNGHSYIGYGPLDPSRYSAADFPASYQLMFVNGCVSFNYYEKDYFPLKKGGTQNLDLITNGLESWVNGSGPAMGRFVGTLLGGTASYKDLLKAAQFTDPNAYDWGGDALRVVDGESDNKYSPKKTPLKITQ
jgi:hypothetical protein